MEHIKETKVYIKTLIKWLLISTVLGAAGGCVGSLFHFSVDFATETRVEKPWIIFLLPLGGLLITFMYRLFRSKGHIDTNLVIESVRVKKKIPFVTVPLIFISTVITHLLGGSAGREGAALQLGGGLGYNFGKILKLKESDIHIIVMTGMSAVFSALFGTPVTAAVFSLEVVSVGAFHYSGFLPCIISSITAFAVSKSFGIAPVRFKISILDGVAIDTMARVFVLAVLCAVISIIFCMAIRKCGKYSKKLVKNSYLRAFLGGLLIVFLTLLVNTRDYNGAGMEIIERAISGNARPWDFILKIIFTAITIAAGFKGGEIVPAFFVGSTFGCVAGSLLGLDAGLGAAVGFTALFCGAVNCPVASVFLAIEVFGTQGILYFALTCAISYMMSGYSGLYKSQKILYSKLDDEYIDVNTK